VISYYSVYFWGLNHTLSHNPYKNKPGYAHYEEIGAYEEPKGKDKESNINSKISKIVDHIDPYKVAELLRQSHASGQPITAQQLFRMGHKKNDALQQNADYLNRLNFLLDLEVASRLVRGDNGEATDYDVLPIGTGWARTQSLIICGGITFSNLGCFIQTSGCHLFRVILLVQGKKR
jgi:hypothetical protein